MGLAFDVYAAANPNGSLLATLTDAHDKSISFALAGTGAGQFTIPRSSGQATAAIIAQGNLVKVRLTELSATPIGSFWMETGRYDLVGADDAPEELTFGGKGALAYIGRAIMWSTTFIGGETGPVNNEWLLYNGLNGSKAGQILRRIMDEATDADRPQQPLPSMSMDFTYSIDSAGNAWATTPGTDAFIANVGDGLDDVVGRLLGATSSLVVQMDANLGLHGYNSFGVNRTSATFTTGKVRLQKGVNLASALTRELAASRIKSHMLAAGDPGYFGTASNATTPIREGFAQSAGQDSAALNALASSQLALRGTNADSIRVGIPYGNTPTTTGWYRPGPVALGGHYWVGDTITVHTGTGAHDYNESGQVIAEITISESAGGDPVCTVALGSTYSGSAFASVNDAILESRTDLTNATSAAVRLAHTLTHPTVVDTLPTLPDASYPISSMVFLTTDSRLYVNRTGLAGGWSTDLSGIAADVVAGTIIAGAIGAGVVNAEALATTIIIASKLMTAAGGRRVELDVGGIRLYDAAEGLLVNIPTNGDPVFVKGQIEAASLVSTATAEIRGTATFDKASTTTIQAGVQAPSGPPSLAAGWPDGVDLASIPRGSLPTYGETVDTSYIVSGGYYDTAGGADGATACWVAYVWFQWVAHAYVGEWKVSDGSFERLTALGSDNLQGYPGYITRIGANWFVQGSWVGTGGIGKFVRSTGALSGSTLTGADYGIDAITTDGTYLYSIKPGATGAIVKTDTTPAHVSTTNITGLPSGFAGHDTLAYADTGGGAHLYIGDGAHNRILELTTAYAVVANADFPSVWNISYGIGYGLIWDGTNFQHAQWASYGHASEVAKYTNWTWTTASALYWVSYAWYDSAGTTHETPVGPRASITMDRRKHLLVQTATIPVGGADDPDQVRVYMVNGATDPGAGAYWLQVTDALTARNLVTYTGSGTHDGTGTAFPGTTGGVVKSALSGWQLQGDGSALGLLRTAAASGLRVETGVIGIVFPNSALSNTATVTFSPAFSGTPVVVATMGGGTSGVNTNVGVDSVSSTQVVLRAREIRETAVNATIDCQWVAIGAA